MPSPCPGMNPYLENPALWSEVHNVLIVAIFNTHWLRQQGLR
jgi:Protein of unknown function (DUF4058)